MEDLMIETVKIDKISQEKRFLFYWYFFSLMQDRTVNEVWSKYEELLNTTENWLKYYESFFENEAYNETIIINEFCASIDSEDKSLQTALKKTWEKVRSVFKKEVDCEKKLYDLLSNKAKDHPIISKIIIAILTGILLGLAKDCIHDTIQSKTAPSTAPVTNIYITDINNNYTQLYYEENRIVIKEIE